MASTLQQFTVTCSSAFTEIIMAEFAMLGFDSFQETDEGFIAHSTNPVETAEVESIIAKYRDSGAASFLLEEVEQVNWNKKWEESYEPIIISEQILVRASFHEPRPELPLEIIINPKMSFGTGHHETTGLMMEQQLMLNHQGKKVLDAGCGTGILTILAGKLGAADCWAYDNDEWVKDNIQENFKINHTISRLLIGTIDTLALPNDFDIILANINLNILLHDIPYYAGKLKAQGSLILSGFYESDLPAITKRAMESGLKLAGTMTKNRWMAARFSK